MALNEPITGGRYLGQLMPLDADPTKFPSVVMRRTCRSTDDYFGRLPASQAELDEYKAICGLDANDIYVLEAKRRGREPTKSSSYGEDIALMILSAGALGLNPAHVDDATALLNGHQVHPMHSAAMESESVRLHNLIAADKAMVDEANLNVAQIKRLYGLI